MPIKLCKKCNAEFKVSQSTINRGFGIYCSRKCEASSRPNPPVECTCNYCGIKYMKPWYDVNKAGGSKFCSRKCIDTFKRKIRKREEQEMFTGWQKREWKDSSCKKCGTTDKLELDHIMPRFAGGKASRENAQTLCRTCNRKKFWTEDYELYQNMLKLRTITD